MHQVIMETILCKKKGKKKKRKKNDMDILDYMGVSKLSASFFFSKSELLL